MGFITCLRCQRQMSAEAVLCPHCDAPNSALAHTDARPVPLSPWERTVPLVLLGVGLLVMAAHGFLFAGPSGGVKELAGVGLTLVVYLPLTIVAMFITAPLMDVCFGEFGTAVLKIAGIYVFTSALLDVVGARAHPILGGIVGAVAALVLFSKAFDLRAAATIAVVLVIAVTRALMVFAIQSFFAAV